MPWSGARHVAGIERLRGHAEHAVFELHSRKPLLVQRLHDDTRCNAQTPGGLCRQKNLDLSHRTPPSSSLDLPCSARSARTTNAMTFSQGTVHRVTFGGVAER